MTTSVKKVIFRDIILYFALAVGICVISVVFLGIYSYINFKNLTNHESISSLSSSFAYEQENLRYINSLHSVWTQAYENIVIKTDAKWIDDNIGSDVSKTFGIDVAAIVNDVGKVEFAYNRGKPMEEEAQIAIEKSLGEILQKNRTTKFNLGVLKEMMRVDDKVYIVSIGEIQPSYDQTTRVEGAKLPKYLILAQEIGTTLISSLKKFAAIDTLEFLLSSSRELSDNNMNSLQVAHDGKVYGYFIWEPGPHARAIISRIIPGFAIALIILVGLTILVGYNISRAALSYDDLIISLKLTTEDLTHAKNAAERSSREKTKFLATMSHEIRTPMNGVVGMLSLLRETELDQQQVAFINTIQSSSDALMKLVDDILEFSQSESKELKAYISPTNVRDLISEIQGLLQPIAIQKNLKFECFFSHNVPTIIETDPLRFRQIILHLASNAFKYTTVGHVRINVNATLIGEESVEVVVQVVDTGPGIPKEAQKNLFTDFFSTEALNSTASGQGLGLGIAKNLVTLLGGKIDFESHPGQGSIFWFSIVSKRDKAADRLENAERV